MKKRKNPPPIENPVLYFGSDVAQDLIKKEVCGHFGKAFRAKETWRGEIHLGMLKAMKGDTSTKEVQSWLYSQCKENGSEVPSLMRRYVLILDTPWRKTDFLAGTKDFWEASKISHSPAPRINYYKMLIHRLAVCMRKLNISLETVISDLEDELAKITRETQD